MNTKHTPGPWEVTNGVDVFTKLGASRNDGLRSAHNDGWHIANCDGMYASVEDGSEEPLELAEQKANARLIAKAPEMLDMLIQCRKEFAGLPHSLGYEFTHLPKLDALIAEATGERA